MKPRDNGEEIALMAMQLRAASAPVWSEFLVSLQRYADARLRAVLSTVPDQILVAQGRAVGLAELVKHLAKAPEIVEAMKQREEK